MRLIEKDRRIGAHDWQSPFGDKLINESVMAGLVVGFPGRDECAIQQGQRQMSRDGEPLKPRDVPGRRSNIHSP